MTHEHIDTPIHTGWVAQTIWRRRGRKELPVTPPPLATVAEVEAFGERLASLSPARARLLRARVAGMSLPEIEAAFGISHSTSRNAVYKTLHHLGLNTGPIYGRMTRAAYFLGRLEGERRG
jgi:hypothetical protein